MEINKARAGPRAMPPARPLSWGSSRSGWRESNPHYQLGNPTDLGLW